VFHSKTKPMVDIPPLALLVILVMLQFACAASAGYSAHPWASPLTGPLKAAFKSAPCGFVVQPSHLLM
ncbi:hypothetical protein, partial [Escherichia coli]|uniref:hypothetical protein n=1 Tax=Escherichia coli TaxID=562 RepID=UPI001BC8618A